MSDVITVSSLRPIPEQQLICDQPEIAKLGDGCSVEQNVSGLNIPM
jgi:hypothetical protein